MNPIVNPWFIYFICKIDTLSNLFIWMAVLICIYTVVMRFLSNKPLKVKTVIVTFCIICTLSALIPSRDTLIAMYVSNQVTTNNVQTGYKWSKKELIDIIDHIYQNTKIKLNKLENSTSGKK